jgi:very-short-patch-repair endonuclease
MTLLKLDSKRLIPMDKFGVCLIDQASKKEITRLYPRRSDGAYYLDKFKNYLKDTHNTSMKDYCVKYLNVIWPQCPTKKVDVGFEVSGKGLILSEFARGGVNKKNCRKFKEGCKRLSQERMGKDNPMFGKTPWNFGKSYDNLKLRGRKLSEKHIQKLRDARARSPLKARHTQKHSEETKAILRIRQAEKWKNGVFNRKTSIEVKVEEYLKELKLNNKFAFQEQVEYFTLDFGDKKSKIGIECQGTFFHTDPRFYPDGPITAIQRRNSGRDKSKRKFFEKRGWQIIELWETEINNGQFKEILKSKLSELGVLEV